MIKSYDFKSPKKFTKERMSTVENLYDSFARALAPYLTGLLQSFCEININGIVEKRYQEFSSSVQDHSLFGMITMSPANKDYNEAPLTMEVDTRLAFFMIERLLGGVGSEYDLSRDFTDIEKAILQYVLKKSLSFRGSLGTVPGHRSIPDRASDQPPPASDERPGRCGYPGGAGGGD